MLNTSANRRFGRMRLRAAALLLTLPLLSTTSLADVLVDNVDGVTLDAEGNVVRFTGLDESISNRIVAGLGKLLAEMAEEPDHPLRLRVEEGLAKMALDLQHDPEVQAKVARVRDELQRVKALALLG